MVAFTVKLGTFENVFFLETINIKNNKINDDKDIKNFNNIEHAQHTIIKIQNMFFENGFHHDKDIKNKNLFNHGISFNNNNNNEFNHHKDIDDDNKSSLFFIDHQTKMVNMLNTKILKIMENIVN